MCFSQQIQAFVAGLFDLNQDEAGFKSALRDFLIRLKVRQRFSSSFFFFCSFMLNHFCLQEFAGEDNQLLFAEETEAELERKRQANLLIPGMIKPIEREDVME